MANIVAKRWKNVDPQFKADLEARAEQNRIRYKKEMKDWELRLKMQADLEAIKIAVNARDEKCSKSPAADINEARAFLETMKKELEQMKPRFHETDVCENENTVADANSKTNGDIEFQYSQRVSNESPAADINEARGFLKGLFDVPSLPKDSNADHSHTHVYTRNVSDASAFSVSEDSADINEARAFLKETFDASLSKHSVAGYRCNDMHIRNVSNVSSFAVNDVSPPWPNMSAPMRSSYTAAKYPSPTYNPSSSSLAFGRRHSI